MLWLQVLSQTMNLGYFVIIGSFLEELLAPIPSPFVMTTAALVAHARAFTVGDVLLVIIVASAAKAVSSFVVYLAAAFAENLVIGKWGHYLGVNQQRIDRVSAYCSGGWGDEVLLFVARAVPLIPTGLISIAAGAIGYPSGPFLLITFLGCVVRNSFYVLLAFYGWDQLISVVSQTRGNPILIGGFMIGGGALLWVLWITKRFVVERLFSTKE